MDGYKVWVVCPQCKGSGKSGDEAEPTQDCAVCKGLKYRFAGWVSKDKFEMPTNLPEDIK